MFKRAFYDLFFFSLAIFCIFLSGVVAASFGLLIFAIIFFILGVILSIISAKLPKRKGETTEMNVWNEHEKYMDACMREYCKKCIFWDETENKCTLKPFACIMGDKFEPKKEEQKK